MIVAFFINILTVILSMISSFSNFFAQNFTIWPDEVLDGISYFTSGILKFDFALNTYALLQALLFFITFDVIYYTVKLLIKFVNWIRGADGLEI